MAYARDLKSLVLYGLVGSNPTLAILFIRKLLMGLLGRQRQRVQQRMKKQTDIRRSQFDDPKLLIIRAIDVKIAPPFIVGERVRDDLTRELHIVIGISYKNGHCDSKITNCHHCWGIWIDSDYLGGGRHPWELTKTEDIRG